MFKISIGINDLVTTHPEIAKQAIGWDPLTVSAGSDKKRKWICKNGHEWDAQIKNRTRGKGCPYCANKKLLVGFNDFETTYPDIASEANGWDPSIVITGSNKKFSWRCSKGHEWEASINRRILQKTRCPYCANKKVLKGFNDLATTHPEIAKQANGWDPSTVLKGSNKFKSWKCNLGHTWNAAINSRNLNTLGCPYCTNNKVLKGFNDLATTHPEIAKQANGCDPSLFVGGCNERKEWKRSVSANFF